MVMLTLKQFQYFIKIVEEGSFTAASEKLFIAQSALSRQMKLLEEEIDFQLFDRTDKKVKLTAAGEVFYKKIKDNMHYLNEIIGVSKNIAEGKNRQIKIAHSSSIIMDDKKVQILKEISLTQKINFEINTLSSEHQILALLNGEIDIGLIRPPVRHTLDDVNVIKLYEEPLMVAVQIDHAKFANKEKVEVKDLKEEYFVSTPHSKRGGLSYLVSNLCLAAGFTPQKAPIQSRKISQLQLVAANVGVSIVPKEFQQILPAQVKLLPLTDQLSLSEVVLVYRKDHDEIIQHCAERIHQIFQF
ncbi:MULTISPECIES: LysR family transcriptional regulator [Acinetobacter]|jgi:DNA-binding transcriptional LysR family regulator|uniref:LysR family transcriptional regulator n=1 Tax=Acinetobacter pittii TaxID=48296 RepID=A0AAE9M7A7_ACIPI|nr:MULTISPECIES: LysR family transcriptional regulator [Acinetobacter]AVZ06106.1 LysR family transcriptional regulator [Acinetobacter pittii]AZP30724.1 LysR family transcriptional regulator [Acinetobacter pittii]EXC30023.1 bacterial regulatory helix-turn-helix, lysR family protein [Acinetobacter sp. 809848]EXE27634.1 bacterial regulatory helix-turn-helix, lysR family protein [Acinetobacter sp. 907131]EXS17944.1 bacterial regulatory helix-turn-helix, lysR family protein [Acinetobacter sp. 88342